MIDALAPTPAERAELGALESRLAEIHERIGALRSGAEFSRSDGRREALRQAVESVRARLAELERDHQQQLDQICAETDTTVAALDVEHAERSAR